MAAAYAAILSILHIIDKIQKHRAFHIKSIGENPLIEALRERAISLLDFLETYHNPQPRGRVYDDEDIDAPRVGLESRIGDAAYEAEDVLESHIVDQIRAVHSNEENTCTNHFDQCLKKVIKDMDLIIKEDVKTLMIKLQKKTEATKDLGEQPTNSMSVHPSSSSNSNPPPSNLKNATAQHMVGFEDYMTQIMEKLTRPGLNRRVIPIIGMGGIGKTTLAINVLEHPHIMHYFHRRAWASISQQFSVRKILLDLLREVTAGPSEQDGREDQDQLGDKLYKGLCGRRYLIILDDIWSIEAWDEVNQYFPKDNNGSCIVVTTRISTLASQLGSSSGLKLDFLDDDKSWDLLCRKVFGDELGGYFPDDNVEVEKLGKQIAKKCRGLPLSIVTIGGLLAKSDKTTEYWKYVLGNLNSIVSSDNNGHCAKILSLSYTHLPIHLRPCLLHMGHLAEDCTIHSTKLVKLWVAEGFIKSNKTKSSEEVAYDYLKDLIDRNLILFKEWKPTGKHDTCDMHDLMRDLCLREANKDKFLYLVNNNTNPNIESQRRLVINRELMKDTNHSITKNGAFVCDLGSASLLRSFLTYDTEVHPSPTYRLLRVLDAWDPCLGFEAFEYVNSRYLNFRISSNSFKLPPSLNLLWNLETLIITGSTGGKPIVVPIEIWGMQQLKHLWIYKYAIIAGPPSSYYHDNSSILVNLAMIDSVINFKLIEDVIWRIPNVRRLGMRCSSELEHLAGNETGRSGDCCVIENLHHLVKLEILDLSLYTCPHFLADNWHQKINFPDSIKELKLAFCRLPWEIIMTKIGSLPHLERLYLWCESFSGDEWNLMDNRGQFASLRFLEIMGCRLKYWKADETSFPNLERLALKSVHDLEKIPLDIGHTPTLLSIYIVMCSQGVFTSAKEILEEQRSYGNETLQVFTQLDLLLLYD